MNLQEIGRLLRDLAPFASLAVILIAGWRLFKRITEAEQKLAGLANELAEHANEVDKISSSLSGKLDEINSIFDQVRYDAERVGRSRPKQIQGLEHYATWDTGLVRDLMKSATERVLILQTWFPEMEADIHKWSFDHAEGLDVRILMAADSNLAIQERVRFRDDFSHQRDESERRQHIAQMVGSCRAMIRKKLNEHEIKGETDQIVLYEHGMPFGPIYILDDRVVFGIYPPHKNCNAAPMMVIPSNCDTGELLLESFETIWRGARKVDVEPVS